jgi:hypothetical protein
MDAIAAYASHVRSALNTPASTTGKSRAEIEADIAAISAELKGPLDNITRLDLVAARTALRKELATVR